jgi:hypothetical protein
MIERLPRTVEELENAPSEVHEEAAERLEALLAERRPGGQGQRRGHDLIGTWSDIPRQQMDSDLDQIRHANPPTPPVERDAPFH